MDIVVWFTGMSGAGKTTIARALEADLIAAGRAVEVLDGDQIRPNLFPDLGFSKQDRDENVRRAGYLAYLLAKHGVIVLVALISPYREARNCVRKDLEKKGIRFLEVYVNAPEEICVARDPRYPKQPYEPPLNAEIECRTASEDLEISKKRVWDAVFDHH